MLTLADIQTAQFQQASGFCPTRLEFLELVNDVVDELMRRGDWPGTLLPIRVCVRNGCITWPRYVGEVRALNSCSASIPVRGQWYEFMEHGHDYGRGAESFYVGWGFRGAPIGSQGLFQYRAPTYNDIYGPNCYVRVYPMAQEDVGATVTIFGTDNDNQPLMTRTGEVWTEGIVLTIPAGGAYASSEIPVSRIDRVVKSVTQNKLNLFAYDATNDVLFDLAAYEPSETNPSYLRYRLDGGDSSTWNNCSTTANNCSRTIVALVKLQKVPIRVATDLVLINNRKALLNGVRAMKSEEAGNIPQAQLQWKVAIETLNRSLEDSEPDQQISIQNNIFGGRTMTNQLI